MYLIFLPSFFFARQPSATYLIKLCLCYFSGDPDVISKVPGRKDLNHLDNRVGIENLQLLNLT